MINPDEVATYFSIETGIAKDSFEVSVDEGIICLKPKRWLEPDKWVKVMELVDAMDGEWEREGEDSHWWFDASWMEARIADMKKEATDG